MTAVEPVYAATVALTRVVFRALGMRIEVTGAERIPRSGPVVLASNHVSFLDFTLVGLVGRPRYVRFLARREVVDHWASGPFMRAMRHVPVDRAAPAAAYVEARRLLRDGEAVGVFPEGGISQAYDVRPLMPGAVALARETGAPLVPIGLWGAHRIATARRPTDLTRGRPVSVAVGEPVLVAPGADVEAETRALGRRLQDLLDGLQLQPRHRPRPGERAPWYPAHLGGSAPTREVAYGRETSSTSAIRWWEVDHLGPADSAQSPVATGRDGSAIQPLQLPG